MKNYTKGLMEAEKKYRKELWTIEEDKILTDHVNAHGHHFWNRAAQKTGLKRSGKSCRLRWKNYLCPNVMQGGFTDQEDDLIMRLHRLLGNRWTLIAGRIPGRTDNQIKNHWNTNLRKIVPDNYRLPIEKKRMDETSVSTEPKISRPVAKPHWSVNRVTDVATENPTTSKLANSSLSPGHDQSLPNSPWVDDTLSIEEIFIDHDHGFLGFHPCASDGLLNLWDDEHTNLDHLWNFSL